MKNIFKVLVLLFAITLVSCDKSLEEVNIDPNTSPTANDAQVLTAAQGYLGYIVDVDLNSNSFLWAQYYTWGIGVSIGNAERFVAQPDDNNLYWERAYANSLEDLKFLSESKSAAYSGVGKALQAYIFQSLVDHFGDVPYSEALRGSIKDGSILTPGFDTEATIYGNLVGLVDDALTDLRSGASASTMGSDDLVYGGDISKWIKFANSLKLRILMRTSELGGNDGAIKTLISEAQFIETSSDIAQVAFQGTTGNENPMYARFTWGVGDFYFASNATINQLNSLSDPRIDAFYSKASTGTFADQFHGIDQGTIDNEPFTAPATDYSKSSPIAYAQDNSVILMSNWETWFLRAEADARYDTADDDDQAFTNAISANFSYLGVADPATYTGTLNYASAANMDAKLDLIGVQKWISMNGTQEDEGWIEARRFDRPASRLFTNGIWQTPPLSILGTGNFPSSWLYPATEMSLNPKAPSQRKITDNIFWDN